jgi:hypothetical protein
MLPVLIVVCAVANIAIRKIAEKDRHSRTVVSGFLGVNMFDLLDEDERFRRKCVLAEPRRVRSRGLKRVLGTSVLAIPS